MSDRLAERLYALGTTQRDAARKLQLTEAAISKWVSGDPPRAWRRLGALASVLNTSADYLLGLTDDPRPPRSVPAAGVAEAAAEYGEAGELVLVPRLSTVAAAGAPTVPDEEVISRYPFRREWLERVAPGARRPGRLVLIKVADSWLGESMLPTIRPGALLLVDREPPEVAAGRLAFGRIYVLFDDTAAEGLTVKRVYQHGRILVCAPDNPGPGREPFVIEVARGEPLARHVRGRVLWVGMELEG